MKKFLKLQKCLKLALTGIAGLILIGANINAGETKNYPKDGKADKVLGHQTLGNSFGVTGSYVGNTVTINKGEPIERAFGAAPAGKEKIEVVKDNTVIIDGGTLAANGKWTEKGADAVRGGSAYGGAAQDSLVTNNTVIIRGNSTIGGNIYGGYSHRGSAVNNKVIVEGNPKFGPESILFGGRGSRSTALKEDKKTFAPLDVVTGNTLELKTGNITVNDVKNFEKIVFNLQADKISENETILTLTNSKGVELEKPEVVKNSSKIDGLPEEEKERIIREKNKSINLKIDVVVQDKPAKSIKNAKVILIHADSGLKLGKLPKDIKRSGKGYTYQVKFGKDDKNLYAIVNVSVSK